MSLYSDVALIIEGGGMRNTYSAGLATALVEAGIRFPFISAVSAGATILSSLLVNDLSRLKKSFLNLAEDPHFGGVRHFIRGHGFFNAHYIYEETPIPGGILPFDYARYEACETNFAIGAFARDSGKMRWFGRRDISCIADLGRIIRASSSLPIIMPPTWINGVCYVDGGLGESIALSPAMAAGYRRFFIIRSQVRDFRKNPTKHTRFMRIWMRKHPILLQAILSRPTRYNQQLDLIDALEDAGLAYVVTPDKMNISRNELSQDALRQAFNDGLQQGRLYRQRWLAFLDNKEAVR